MPNITRPTGKQAEQLMGRISGYHRDGDSGHHEWLEKAKENRAFFRGDQWDDADVAQLDEEGRPHLTINSILPVVAFLCGVQRQNRKDFRIRPRRGGADRVAALLTSILKHMMDVSDGHAAASECFRQGIVTSKGWLSVEIDRGEDPIDGDLRIRSWSPFRVLEDPNGNDYDLADSQWVELWDWMDKDRVQQLWPEAAKEILSGATQMVDPMKATDASGATVTGFVQAMVRFVMGRESDREDVEASKLLAEHRWPVHTTYWRETIRQAYLLDKRSGQMRAIEEDDDENQQRAKEAAERWPEAFAYAEDVPARRVNRTRWVGDVVLDHADDFMYGLDLFPVARYCPWWDDGKCFGAVDNLKDPQTEKNKRRSQVLHLLNTTANSGWRIGRSGTPQAMEKLQFEGARSGVVLDESQYGGKLERLEPPRMSEGHFTLGERASEDLREISGINEANRGEDPGRQSSGIENQLRQRQGLTLSEVLFDNFDATIQLVGRIAVGMIRRHGAYSDWEIRQIAGEEGLLSDDALERAYIQVAQDTPPPPVAGPEDLAEVAQSDPQAAEAIVAHDEQALALWQAQAEPKAREIAIHELLDQVRNWSVGRYAVAISDSPENPTIRYANHAELVELNAQFPGLVSPSMLVDGTGLPPHLKDELRDRAKRMETAMTSGAEAPAA